MEYVQIIDEKLVEIHLQEMKLIMKLWKVGIARSKPDTNTPKEKRITDAFCAQCRLEGFVKSEFITKYVNF